MIVIMDDDADQYTSAKTLSEALQKWYDCYGFPCDITKCLIVEGKQKKASIVLTDVEVAPRASAKKTAAKK